MVRGIDGVHLLFQIQNFSFRLQLLREARQTQGQTPPK